MELKSSNGNSFKLEIIGYQFPKITDCEYDSNWLMIQVHITHAGRSWTARDPSLLTSEVAMLSRWLKHHDPPHRRSQACEFMEPNLKFRFSDDFATLSIHFSLELLPDWIPNKYSLGSEVQVDFPVSELDLNLAAAELDQQLAQFPQRVKSGDR